MATENVCRSCPIRIGDRELVADLMVLDMRDFDVILGMDWLATHHASINCRPKEVTFQILGQAIFTFVGSNVFAPIRMISVLQAKRMLRKG